MRVEFVPSPAIAVRSGATSESAKDNPMQATEIAQRLTSMAEAAGLLEAIDDPALQAEIGWNLSGWSYELIPWGVEFVQHDHARRVIACVVVLNAPESRRGQIGLDALSRHCPTTVLMLG